MDTWAQSEMETANLGDRRLNARAAVVLDQLGAHPQYSIPAACGGWSETVAAYRFFNNPKTDFESILAPHLDATLQRMAAYPVVLLVQDTTENDESVCLGPKGIGTVQETEKRERRLHPTVAFAPDRVCLGVVQALRWQRAGPSPRKERRTKGVDEKESARWVESYQGSCALQGQLPHTTLVNIADAEGDMYEWFAEYDSHAPVTRAEWIVRAAQDRCLDGVDPAPDGAVPTKPWEALRRAPALGQLEVDVGKRPNRPARTARVTVRSTTVKLAPPHRDGYRLPDVTAQAVWVHEDTAPSPGVGPLEWLLLTSLPVDTFERAAQVVAW